MIAMEQTSESSGRARYTNVSVRIDKETKNKIDAVSRDMGISTSELIRRSIRWAFGNDGYSVVVPQTIIDALAIDVARGDFFDVNDAACHYLRQALNKNGNLEGMQ